MNFKKLVLGMSLFSFCIFFLTSPSVYAARPYPTSEAACTPIDFRDSFPMKMRDQGKLAWCFAAAAADDLQATFQIPEQISAADIAINYSQSRWSRLVHFLKGIFSKKARMTPAQTGIIKYAVQMILPQGYCPESALPSDQWQQITPDQTSHPVEILASILDIYRLQNQVQSGEIKTEADLPYYYGFTQINRTQFFTLLQTSKQKNLLLDLREAACQGLRKPFVNAENISARFILRSKRIFEKLNASFDQHQPVTVDFFADAYYHFDHFKKRISDLHTVLLYGRKYDPELQQCVYLMKNSHGPSCDPYDPRLHCDGGYLWFPENALYRSLLSALVLYHF